MEKQGGYRQDQKGQKHGNVQNFFQRCVFLFAVHLDGDRQEDGRKNHRYLNDLHEGEPDVVI